MMKTYQNSTYYTVYIFLRNHIHRQEHYAYNRIYVLKSNRKMPRPRFQPNFRWVTKPRSYK